MTLLYYVQVGSNTYIFSSVEPVGGRPMSARTEKARKMHDAYLKSTGMGKYAAPSSNSFSRHESKGLKRKPNLLDDTQ